MAEYDQRFDDLGKNIWDKVVELQAMYLAAQHGTPNMKAEAPKRIRDLERGIWGLLQTLFRGGVFPEDITDPDDILPNALPEKPASPTMEQIRRWQGKDAPFSTSE